MFLFKTFLKKKGFFYVSKILNLQSIFIYYLAAINVIAYLVMWYDKYQAKKKSQRISENALLTIAVAFGAPGIYLGMKTPIYHKAGKPKFKILIPCLMLLQCVLLFYFILSAE